MAQMISTPNIQNLNIDRDYDNNCPICFDNIEKPVYACSAKHTFCHDCLKKAMNYNSRCPLCRENIKIIKNVNSLVNISQLKIKWESIFDNITSSLSKIFTFENYINLLKNIGLFCCIGLVPLWVAIINHILKNPA